MRKRSLMDRIGLFGRTGIDILAVLGRSTVFLFHALLWRGGIGGGFGLLMKMPDTTIITSDMTPTECSCLISKPNPPPIPPTPSTAWCWTS